MLERGFVIDDGKHPSCTDYAGLDEALVGGGLPAYIGFDATANSLHAGSLIQIMMLRWLQQTGSKPIILMGGGTTKVGDPSGRSKERPILTDEKIKENISGIQKVFAAYIKYGSGPTDAVMVNNSDWLDDLNYLEFLRNIGRHFSVNRMLSFESVKRRLKEEQSLSFLEFNYMILQAYDFLELSKRYGCKLQMGGKDQWGNIVNGTELTRRAMDREVFGLTSELMVTSEGNKMGKTQAGAIWLSPEMCSPYEFWQYWRNTSDADVARYLKLYTEIPIDECNRLGVLKGAELNEAKIVLANETTSLLHGTSAAKRAQSTAQQVFDKNGTGTELPSFDLIENELNLGVSLVKILVKTGLVQSGKEAKRLIAENGAKIDDNLVNDPQTIIGKDALKKPIKLSAGKKRHIIVRLIK